MTDSAPARLDPWWHRRAPVLFFLLLVLAQGSWTFATPLFASPDEPAHMIKAVGVVRGQLIGQKIPDPTHQAFTLMTVPTWAANSNALTSCFAFKPQNSAACQAPLGHDTTPYLTKTYVGRYPLLYYGIVGWPSRIASGPRAVYLMRLVAVLLSCSLITTAFVSLRRLSALTSARLLPLAMLTALTPMVLFLGSVIQPSGLEISAGLATWVGGLVLAVDRGRPQLADVLRFFIPAAALTSVRALSPVLLAIVGSVLLLYAGRHRVVELVTNRVVRLATAGLAVVVLIALAWIKLAHALDVAPNVGYPKPGYPGKFGLPLIRKIIGKLPFYCAQFFRVFCFLDTYQPHTDIWIWSLMVLLFILVGLVRRPTLRQLWFFLFVVGLPSFVVALTYSQVHKSGFIGQGRYYLPLAIGLPFLACIAAGAKAGSSLFMRWLALIGALALAGVHAAAFLYALRRYRTGTGGALFTTHAPWNPPVNAYLLWGVEVVAVLLLTLVVLATTRRPHRPAHLATS